MGSSASDFRIAKNGGNYKEAMSRTQELESIYKLPKNMVTGQEEKTETKSI